jgi:hypothetical protein
MPAAATGRMKGVRTRQRVQCFHRQGPLAPRTLKAWAVPVNLARGSHGFAHIPTDWEGVLLLFEILIGRCGEQDLVHGCKEGPDGTW